MLRRLGIRSKVLAVLAVPMLVVLLAGVFISFESVRDLRDARTARQVVDLVATYVPLNAALNDERVASLTAASPEEVAAARQRTDAAVADFEATASGIDLSRYTATLSPRLAEVLRQLSADLPQIRANVDNAQLRVVGRAYATFVSTQTELVEAAAHELTDRDLATYLAAYAAVARTADGLADEYVAGRDLLTRTADSPAAGQSFATLASQTELLRATARTAVGDLRIAAVALPTRDPSAAFTQIRTVLATGNVVQMAAISVNTYRTAFTQQNESFRSVADGALTEAAAVADRSITSAWQRTLVTVGAVALAAAASLVLALVVSRAIVIPLRRLTAAATDVREELPRLVEQVQVPGEGPQLALSQIPVTTRDEVGRLAAAFNAVNSTTVQVAQEQAALRGSIAEMFVNVARRDQVLLNRQLSFIDSLERTEEDPQALANLFRLDHLATRMRRNAESLLVLAGIDSGRRLRDALPLSDVVRTASSEIEQYDRVQLDLQADPHMLGFNALPAAHLLAELLENATVFSEPETPVVVTTAVAGPYVEVRIVDEGLGMTEAELSAANEKIASTSAGDALGAQRLGLYVVGRLAQRLSAEVILRKSRHTAAGTETVVRFPATLFQSTEASPLGAYGHGVTAAQVPEVDEVDLTALTDGTTPQGLPRRRTVDAPSGAAPLPTRLPARQPGPHDEGIVLPPVASPDALPADLSSGAPDWSPVVQPGGSGLPTRTAAAADAAPAPGPEPAPAVPDPAAHAGRFAGFFRGRGEAASAPQAPSPDEASADTAAAAAVAGVPGPSFVVPGLVPEDETNRPAWDVSEPETFAPAAWAFDEPADPGPAFADPGPSFADPGPAYAAPAQGFAEAVDEAAPASLPTREPPAFGDAEPVWAADLPAWSVPDDAFWAADETTAVPQDAAVPAVEEWSPAIPQPWSAPAADTGQWPVAAEPTPADADPSDAFAGVTGWPVPDTLESEVYAPFERTLDEARAWATGSIPAVPDHLAPAAQVDDFRPDVSDPTAHEQAEVAAPEPVADQAPELVAPLPTPAWEPISAATAVGSSPAAPEGAAEPKRRRGLFGRRSKEPKQAKGVPAPADQRGQTPAWAPSTVPPPMPAPPSIVTTPPPRPVPAAADVGDAHRDAGRRGGGDAGDAFRHPGAGTLGAQPALGLPAPGGAGLGAADQAGARCGAGGSPGPDGRQCGCRRTRSRRAALAPRQLPVGDGPRPPRRRP